MENKFIRADDMKEGLPTLGAVFYILHEKEIREVTGRKPIGYIADVEEDAEAFCYTLHETENDNGLPTAIFRTLSAAMKEAGTPFIGPTRTPDWDLKWESLETDEDGFLMPWEGEWIIWQWRLGP